MYNFVNLVLEGNDSDKFNSIMDELCYEYGELVYHSIEIIREFYEILSVKNNLFDWLKDLQKEMKIHENEINNLKITLKSKTIVQYSNLVNRYDQSRKICIFSQA
jgi:hypothetical protein